MKKKLLAGFLAFALVASGIVVAPEKAEAADTGIVYKEATEIPTMAGYVFGGWYDAEDGNVLDKTAADAAETKYAKMVPDYVLSVKAQITTGTAVDSETTSLRVISSVDSTDYQKVGFKILAANETLVTDDDGNATESVKVYTGLKASGSTVTPQTIFGDASSYISTWRLDGIGQSSFGTVVYVQPYWVTMDGTTVNGLARFLRVEDSYLNYISVPVNLTTDVNVAAGALTLDYDEAKVKVVDIEEGNVFDEMAWNDDGAQIKFVGNGSVVDSEISAKDLYASVRFEIIDETYTGAASGTFLNFTIVDTSTDFADWDENSVAIDAADVQY